MAASVYLETTTISYLAALPSRDLVVAAHQEVTREWWRARRQQFDLFVSELVVREVRAGNRDAVARRMDFLEGISSLRLTQEVRALARRLVEARAVSFAARADALHIAVATVHGIDYLMTWNCRHIANAESRSRIVRTCHLLGYVAPILCTPEELMGE
jgi:predicted nucleic acid-binding protein